MREDALPLPPAEMLCDEKISRRNEKLVDGHKEMVEKRKRKEKKRKEKEKTRSRPNVT